MSYDNSCGVIACIHRASHRRQIVLLKWFRVGDRFRSKYHPEEYDKCREQTKAALQKRCDVFSKLMDMNMVANVSLDAGHTNDIIKLLDAGLAILPSLIC